MDLNLIEAIYPLSSMQKGILFYSIQNDYSLYFQQNVLKINGQISLIDLESSLNLLINSHDVLRAVILYDGTDEPIHVILKERKSKIEYIDISLNINKSQDLSEIIARDKKRSFDLTKDILFRITVIKFDENVFYIIVSYHHIIIDGWSATILINKLFNYYYSLLRGDEPKLDKGVAFENYINKIHNQEKDNMSYWRNYLDGYSEQTEFVSSSYIGNVGKTKYKTIVLDKQQQKKLFDLSERCKVTINILLKGIFALLFQRYILANDIVFGEIVSGRNELLEDMENMVGLFINMLPLRVTVYEGMRFSDMLQMMQNDSIQSYQHMHISLQDVQKECFYGKSLIKLFYNFSNHPKSININGNSENFSIGFEVEDVNITGEDNYDFCITVMPLEQYSITIRYNSSKYSEEFVSSIFEHFFSVINQVYSEENIEVNDITLQDKDSMAVLIKDTEVTENMLLKNEKINLFENLKVACDLYPHKKALFYLDKSYSYIELYNQVNTYAHQLKKQNINHGDVIGVYMEKGFEFIAAMFAVLQIGGVFMPMDISYPRERHMYMIKNSGAAVVMINEDNEPFSGPIWLHCKAMKSEEKYLPVIVDENEGGAYLIYTSGTSGQPKGVLLSSKNILHYSQIFIREFKLSNKDIVLSQSSVGFDVFIEELFPALFVGASILLINQKTKYDMNALKNEIIKHGVTVISCTPRYLQIISTLNLNCVRLYISGGESLKNSYINQLIENKVVYNTYGPTETSVCATYHKCSTADEENIPIGKPLPNYKIRILDQFGNIQPRYVRGEIFIGGEGLSMGYYNESELTNRNFLSIKNDSDIYFKTGDIGYWNKQNEICFSERCDRQVKVRGYRIELNEVESTFLSIDGINDAYVTVIENDISKAKYLCAFVVAEMKITKEYILDKIKKMLPYYMIPQKLNIVESILLSSNGKVDEKEMYQLVKEEKENEIRELTDIEAKICEVWSKVLKIPQDAIGIHDNFFEIGGDSILLIKLNADLNNIFSDKLSIGDYFIYQNIEELGSYLQRILSKQDNNKEIEEGDLDIYQTSFPKIELKLFQELISNQLTIESIDVFLLLCNLAVINMENADQISLYSIANNDVFVPISCIWNKENDIEEILMHIVEKRTIQEVEGIRDGSPSEITIFVGKWDKCYLLMPELEKRFDVLIFLLDFEEEEVIRCRFHSDHVLNEFIEKYISYIFHFFNEIKNISSNREEYL